jgi:hypothetical protein
VIKWRRVQWAGQVACSTNEKCIPNLIENFKGFSNLETQAFIGAEK